jgi:PAS domain S-box-containing protein
MKKRAKVKRRLSKGLTQTARKVKKQAGTTRRIEVPDEKPQMSKAIFDYASEGIVVTNSKRIIQSVNPGFCAITGYKPDEVIGKKISLLNSNRHDSDFYHTMWEKIHKDGIWQGEIWDRRKNGEIYPQWLTIAEIRNGPKKSVSYIGLFTDITRYISKNIQIRNHAYYDTLTGLPNRILLHDRLSFMISHAKRNHQIMAILLLDLNRFKFINDTLGYTTGDQIGRAHV